MGRRVSKREAANDFGRLSWMDIGWCIVDMGFCDGLVL